MKLLFVDDMETRHRWIKQVVLEQELNSKVDLYHAYSARAANHWLEKERFDVVSLDHDMLDEHYAAYHVERELEKAGPDGLSMNEAVDVFRSVQDRLEQMYRDGTGAEVAAKVASLEPPLRPDLVVLHSWNPTGVQRMAGILRPYYDDDTLVVHQAHSLVYLTWLVSAVVGCGPS